MADAVDVQRLVAVLEARLDKYDRAMNKAVQKTDQSFTKIERRGKAMESSLAALGLGISRGIAAGLGPLVALYAAGALGKNFIEKTIAQQDAVQQLEAVLKSTAGVAGVTSQAAQDLASSLQKVTTYGDETIIPAEALLLTFTKIGKDIFPKATEVMLDMSTALKQDLKSSAVQLGKALQDPILGVTALRRVGVNFNEAQTKVIKNLVETGQQAKAQALILKELQTEFGGSARAARDTLGGALKSLSNALGDTFELHGPEVENLRLEIESLIATIQDPEFRQAMADIGAGMVNMINSIANGTEAMVQAVDTMRSKLDDLHSQLQKVGNSDFWKQISVWLAQHGQRLPAGSIYIDPQLAKAAGQMPLGDVVDKSFAAFSNGAMNGASSKLQDALNAFAANMSSSPSTPPPPPPPPVPQNDLEKAIALVKEHTASITAETAAQAGLNPLVNDYGFTLAKVRTEQDLLSAAQKAGIAITPDLKQKIEDLAGAYATASAEADKLKESQDKAKQAAEDMAALQKDVIGGFISDLAHGTSAADAFANALGKIGDKLLEMALNNLFSPTTGLGGTGFKGIFGGTIIPGILHSGGVAGSDGYGHGRSVSPAVFSGAPRYHKGGIAGLRPDEVPAILQRGEVITPRGSKSGGGVVVSLSSNVTVQGDGDAAKIKAALDARDRQLKRDLPAMIADARMKRRLIG